MQVFFKFCNWWKSLSRFRPINCWQVLNWSSVAACSALHLSLSRLTCEVMTRIVLWIEPLFESEVGPTLCYNLDSHISLLRYILPRPPPFNAPLVRTLSFCHKVVFRRCSLCFIHASWGGLDTISICYEEVICMVRIHGPWDSTFVVLALDILSSATLVSNAQED